jgi:hypothetical protein
LFSAQLAENSLVHSNGARTGITYGKIPNYKYTWDYNKVWGCQCDQDYTGYDCSLRLCPKGDDPITGNGNGPQDPVQVKEVQTISCMANSGTFRLRFRNYETVDIPYDSDIYGVEKALEDLQSTGGATYQGDVTVEVAKGDPNCNATVCCAHNRTDGTGYYGNTLSIYFISELGNLPEMVVSQNLLGPYNNGTGQELVDGEGPVAIAVATTQEGTTENGTLLLLFVHVTCCSTLILVTDLCSGIVFF